MQDSTQDDDTTDLLPLPLPLRMLVPPPTAGNAAIADMTSGATEDSGDGNNIEFPSPTPTLQAMFVQTTGGQAYWCLGVCFPAKAFCSWFNRLTSKEQVCHPYYHPPPSFLPCVVQLMGFARN